MAYLSLEEFRDQLLSYLEDQKQYLLEDIEAGNLMTDDEKIDNGLLIVDAIVNLHEDNDYELTFKVNFTKVRPGDQVVLVSDNGTRVKAIVIENQTESMIIRYRGELPYSRYYRIEVNSVVLLDPLINLLKSIETGQPGAYFLKMLANLEAPEESIDGLQVPTNDANSSYSKLNQEQKNICEAVLQCPSVYTVQGPPGTGKTDVLGVITQALVYAGKNVVVLAKTHHAVNNALNKVQSLCKNAHVSKIGSKLKSDDVNRDIRIYEKYCHFQSAYRKRPFYRGRSGDVVGMTLQSAIINLGLVQTTFRPDLVLVDEASQITLAEASVVGVFGAYSVIFFGDDKQMPPIFHEKQRADDLSVSIFSHLIKLYPSFEGKLCVTYRMNDEITKAISLYFYEPFGEKIIASAYSKDRRLQLKGRSQDSRINHILTSEESIITLDVTNANIWEDSNPDEADFIAQFVEYLHSTGMDIKDIAIVTPYRRQVLAIRSALRTRICDNIPIVDTVERLQGQSVSIVILSFCVSSEEFYKQNMDFLLNRCRLNVMISRAKTKVVIIKSRFINIGI